MQIQESQPGVRGQKSPAGSKSRAPVGGLRNKVTQKLKGVSE